MVDKKKAKKLPRIPWFAKLWSKLYIYIVILFIVILAFFLGVFVEFSYNIVQKNTQIHNFLQTVGNQQQSEEVYYYELEVDVLKSTIYDFVKLYFGEDDSNYVERVTNAYLELFNRVPENDKHYILYYIALCSVESNFKMSARSDAGAVGIAQVMWSVWGEVIQENYGVSKESLYTSVEDNIYVGFMIWRNYLRQNEYDVRKANAGYLGTNNVNYHNKINFRFVKLIHSLLKHQFNSGVRIRLVTVED